MAASHLAQLNIARAVAPIDSPVMAEFIAALAGINALADASPGFVWRLQDDTGDATSIRPYADPLIIVNLSVWESISALRAFAYKSRHIEFVRRRHEWFESLEQRYLALWWLPAGRLPTVIEAQERLDHLRRHDETPYAFSFQKVFEPELFE